MGQQRMEGIFMGMKKFYEGASNFGIPQNIHDFVHASFTKVETDYTADNKIVISVPEDEDRQISDFNEGVKKLLHELKAHNGVLADKLARLHKFNL
jgi:hypothetical protein